MTQFGLPEQSDPQHQPQVNNDEPARDDVIVHPQIDRPSNSSFPGNQTPKAGQTPSHVPEYQQIMLQRRIPQAQQRPSQANYIIQPPRMNRKPQRQRRLPRGIRAVEIQRIVDQVPIGEDDIRMLILLENGEQRLITFCLPGDPCTIKEILQQVHVPFQNHTNIQVIDFNSRGINYIVTVGNIPARG